MAITIMGCSNDDGDSDVSSPSITYSSTNETATFFENGNSSSPTIEWNGNQGTISLSSTIEGLSINSTTGVLNWNKQLKPGDYSFDIVATNSGGQTTVSFNLSNPFQGTFTGNYSGSFFFELEFNIDGTMEARANNPDTPNIAIGTWQLDNNTLTAEYTYQEVNDEYSISGTLNQSSTQVIYTGDYYIGFGTDPDNISDSFEVIME